VLEAGLSESRAAAADLTGADVVTPSCLGVAAVTRSPNGGNSASLRPPTGEPASESASAGESVCVVTAAASIRAASELVA
jgi:hypothetical protein